MGCGSGHFGHFGHLFSRFGHGHQGHRGSHYDRGDECHSEYPQNENDEMLKTAKMRFVNGEINEEEYIRLKIIILDS